MADVVIICPVPPDRVVIDPTTGDALRPDGSLVSMTPFWRRRLKAGVVRVQPPKTSAEEVQP